jgi:hypothetical protein
MRPRFGIEVLAGEAQIVAHRDPIAVGVLVCRRRPEGVTVPLPYGDLVGVGDGSGGIQMIAVDVVQAGGAPGLLQ